MAYNEYGNRFQRTTPVVLNLVIINVLVWIGQLMLDKNWGLTDKIALFPYNECLIMARNLK